MEKVNLVKFTTEEKKFALAGLAKLYESGKVPASKKKKQIMSNALSVTIAVAKDPETKNLAIAMQAKLWEK